MNSEPDQIIYDKNTSMNDIELEGCAPVPLAYYLKALGIFRLVAEQKDIKARGYWKNDRFHLVTRLTREELIDFFLKEYVPTPIVSPWNGGSGFSPKDYQEGINFIQNNNDDRFNEYKTSINVSKNIRNIMKIKDKVPSDEKDELLLRCRNKLPEDTLKWLDSAFVITSEKIMYPPLLGTGGNDGRLDFSKNFMQNIVSLNNLSIDENSIFIKNSLFGERVDSLNRKGAIGQFYPSATGGMNATAGYNAETVINYWDYILTLEGSLFLSASSSRRFMDIRNGALSYPFSVRSNGAGYGSSSKDDSNSNNSRAEIWLPIWNKPSRYIPLKMMFSEGRSMIGRRFAGNGVDFARAIASLGVDRGIDEFQRYGFMVRNGLAYFATPIGRFRVNRQPQIDLLKDIDGWLDNFRSKASSDQAPNSIRSSANKLDGLIMELCQQKSNERIKSVLVELGRIENELNNSQKWTSETARIKPIPHLSKKWIHECNDGSAEFRIALSMASISGKFGKKYLPIRKNIEPVIETKNRSPFFKFDKNEDINEVVDTGGNIIDLMIRLMSRRIIKAQSQGCDSYPDFCRYYCSPSDISNFIEGRLNDKKIKDLFFGLVLINWWDDFKLDIPKPSMSDSMFPDSIHMIMKLCYCSFDFSAGKIPIVPEIHRICASGDGTKALQIALRRLRGSGIVPAINTALISRNKSKRIAASLFLPVHENQIQTYLIRIGRPQLNENNQK